MNTLLTIPNAEHNMVCGPMDSQSNVILRILKKHVLLIEKGCKNHEYCDYLLDQKVTQVWLFVDEDQTIQFILTIDTPKLVGQVNNSNRVGNDDFNNGLKASHFSYPIKAVHKLPKPLGTEELLQDYKVDMITSGKKYARQTLVDAFPLEDVKCVI